jgi:hypothetical protein
MAEPFEATLRRKNAGEIAVVSAFTEGNSMRTNLSYLASFCLFVAFAAAPVDAQPNANSEIFAARR